ncbi:MAG: ATP-binding protein [Thermoanaerobaculia bacterium]
MTHELIVEGAAGGLTPSRAPDLLDAVLENTTDPTIIVDGEGVVLRFNSAAVQWSGRSLGAAIRVGRKLEGIVGGPPQASVWTDLFARAKRGAVVFAETTQGISGEIRQYSLATRPAPPGVVFTLRDISDYRRAESHEFFQLALGRIFAQNLPVVETLELVLEAFCESIGWDFGVAWLVDSENRILRAETEWFAPGFVRSVAPRPWPEFALGHGIPGRVWATRESIWYPDLLDETRADRFFLSSHLGLRATVAFPLLGTESVLGVLEFFSRRVTPVGSHLTVALEEVGSEIGHYLERKKAESERTKLNAALERSTSEWQQTFDAINSPILITDREGVIVRLNNAARDLGRIDSPDQTLVGRHVAEVGSCPLWRSIGEVIRSVSDSEQAVSLNQGDESEGKIWDIDGSFSPGLDDGNDRVIVILRDLTTVVQLQDSVRKGEQLWAMGELVAGVAHEVRNPLFGISATLDALEVSVPVKDQSRELFDALRQWIDRLNDLMENLLEYGKTWSMNLARGTLDPVVDQAMELCEPLARSHSITFSGGGTFDGELILIDPVRLVQVFQNLITNAIQHSPEGTRVDIERRVSRDRDRTWLVCEVLDRGNGFREEDLSRIFQPFFTRRRGGTGLGLSIVQRIVEEHGGVLHASNREGGGASLRVAFPSMRKGGSS